MENTQFYAVVKFINDDFDEEVTSEVPALWLTKENKKCWWPKTKNINSLIFDRTVPNNTGKWDLLDVVFEGYYESLEEAQKKASYMNASSDEELESGTRKKIRRSESDDSLLSSPPTYSLNEVKELKSNLVRPVVADQSSSLHNIVLDNFAKLFKTLDGIQLHLKCMDNRLALLESRFPNDDVGATQVDSYLFKDIFPLKTWEELHTFERHLQDETISHNFMQHLKQVGGSDIKNHLVRMWKRVFSNQLAQECSWLGRRNNRKICDLKTTALIKETVYVIYGTGVRDKEFEEITSEWFRQAKQRFIREQNRNSSLS
ncbi:hypothetical protein FQR65_LT07537 [Abscondita terminalis]|nr:hypothetical protein FQR65_LT07537 [Abscondita terminalis]